MTDLRARLTFAHLPFELRDQIWTLADEAEDEQPGVHNLTVYNLKSEKASEHTRHGTITFEMEGPEDEETKGNTATYGLRLWGTVDGLPASTGMANVCPESRQVVRKAGKSVTSGVYSTKDSLTQRVWMCQKWDLFFVNIFSPGDIDWQQAVRDIPLFRQGVRHVAFRVDPAWYRFNYQRDFHTFHRYKNPDNFWQERFDAGKKIKPLERIAWSLAVSDWARKVWLIAPDLHRVKPPGRLGQAEEYRQVFHGNGCRYVEVLEGDTDIWHEPRRTENRRTVFDLVRILRYEPGWESNGRDPNPCPADPNWRDTYEFPKLGVLACERMT